MVAESPVSNYNTRPAVSYTSASNLHTDNDKTKQSPKQHFRILKPKTPEVIYSMKPEVVQNKKLDMSQSKKKEMIPLKSATDDHHQQVIQNKKLEINSNKKRELDSSTLPTILKRKVKTERHTTPEEGPEEDAGEGKLTIADVKPNRIVSGSTRHERVQVSQRVQEAMAWLLQTLTVLANATIPMHKVEEAYDRYCCQMERYPLAPHVLSRLLQEAFPTAARCRLGPRGNQRIHFIGIEFKTVVYMLAEEPPLPSAVVKCEPRNDSPLIHDLESEDSSTEEYKDEPIGVEDLTTKTTSSQVEYDMVPEGSDITSVIAVDKTCVAATVKLKMALKWMKATDNTSVFLRDFAHSATCQDAKCQPLCRLFRRVRHHVMTARHECTILPIYTALLQEHVRLCVVADCGLPSCPALKNMQAMKRRSLGLHNQLELGLRRRDSVSSGGSLSSGSQASSPELEFVDVEGSFENHSFGVFGQTN